MSWDSERLGDIVSISKGKKHVPDENGINRYINIENLHDTKNSLFTNDEGIFVGPDDLIIAWDGANAGKVGQGFEGVIGSTLARLQIKKEGVDSRFLYWFLESINELIKSQRTGATIPHVNGQMLKEIQVPLPPLPVQKRIAEILDAADALRRKDQELLNKYDELAQAIFIDMFGDPVKNEKGWEVKRLGEIFDIQLGKMLSSNLNKGTHSKKYLRNINVQWGIVNTDDLKEMLFTDKELDKFRVEKGDILVCEGGAVGRTAVYRNSEEIYFQKSLHRLRPKETGTINATYFEGFMRSAVSNGLLDKIVVSATIAHLTLEKLKELEIIHPDFETQNRYAKAIEIIRHSKNSECANILFENLLCQLVSRNMSKE